MAGVDTDKLAKSTGTSTRGEMAGVGTDMLAEATGAGLKSWVMQLAPGETAPFHEHSHDYVFVVEQGSTLAILDESGAEMCRADLPAGTSMGFKVEADSLVPVCAPAGSISDPIPRAHAAKNVGSTTFREVLVENLRPPERTGVLETAWRAVKRLVGRA